tara:strand:- start:1247 stop:1558 length:312 start_codon:yes stop_codon:yes gene_type:complete
MTYLISALTILLLFFGYFCIKFALALIRVQEAIEDSLDEIDRKYNRMSEILKIPVFFDSPEIKNLISEIYDVRESVVYVADRLSGSVNKKTKADIEEKSDDNF